MNYANNNTQNAIFIFQRLKFSLGLKKDLQLAERLKVKPTTLSTWKKRNSPDYRLVIDFCHRNQLDLNYIFLGAEKAKQEVPDSDVIDFIAKKVEGKLTQQINEVTAYQSELMTLLDKMKALEEIQKAKKKVATSRVKKGTV